jgi:galactose mutarotase-like enzyme
MNQYVVNTLHDIYPAYELAEPSTASSVRICPARGGIAYRLVLQGAEILYLDAATFADPAANIRGGNPILFPISGQLPNKQYEWNGRAYPMNNHGFARNMEWEVLGFSTEGEASLTLRLTSDDSTLESYPFAFELIFTYRLRGGELRIDQSYRNLSDAPMPMYPGFHPYFRAASKSIVYDTDASTYLDYNDYQQKPITGAIDLDAAGVESVALLDASRRSIAFEAEPGIRIRMAYSGQFRYLVLWSVPGKPFVCVEPWMALNGELDAQQELVMVPQGQVHQAYISIGID